MNIQQELSQLKDIVADCTLCPLAQGRKQTVFGEGSATAKIMFIGEAPGLQEDLSGRPFIGPAGQLLTRIIENGMQLDRQRETFITNLLKCRPYLQIGEKTKDRPPQESEIVACHGYLKKQISLIKPKIIIALGSPATKFLLNTTTGITKIHGIWGQYSGIPVLPIFHPSYVLRNGGEKSPLKKVVWQDIKKAIKKMKEVEQ